LFSSSKLNLLGFCSAATAGPRSSRAISSVSTATKPSLLLPTTAARRIGDPKTFVGGDIQPTFHANLPTYPIASDFNAQNGLGIFLVEGASCVNDDGGFWPLDL
jgi:hypothetical protein